MIVAIVAGLRHQPASFEQFGVRMVVSGIKRRAGQRSSPRRPARRPARKRARGRGPAGWPGNRQRFGRSPDIVDAAEEADLESGDRHVLQQRPRLILDTVRVDGQNAAHADRVLDGQRRRHRQRMAADRRQVIRSACRPAPPEGSLAAKVSTMGGDGEAGRGFMRAARGSGKTLGSMISVWLESMDFLDDSNRKPMTTTNTAIDQPYQTWMCLTCGFIYDEAAGQPEEGIAPGTRWAGCTDQLDLSGMRCAQGRLRNGRNLKTMRYSTGSRKSCCIGVSIDFHKARTRDTLEERIG
jgi:hypothetical protein